MDFKCSCSMYINTNTIRYICLSTFVCVYKYIYIYIYMFAVICVYIYIKIQLHTMHKFTALLCLPPRTALLLGPGLLRRQQPVLPSCIAFVPTDFALTDGWRNYRVLTFEVQNLSQNCTTGLLPESSMTRNRRFPIRSLTPNKRVHLSVSHGFPRHPSSHHPQRTVMQTSVGLRVHQHRPW